MFYCISCHQFLFKSKFLSTHTVGFVLQLPDFKPKRTRSENSRVSNTQTKQNEIHKIPKFGVNQASFD